MKRLMDIVISFTGLLISAPLLLPVITIIWLQDFRSPFYIAPRVGKNGRTFKMVKLRSMVVGADRTGVTSTSSKDPRITFIGRFVRTYKLDEFGQLWNVLVGDMSLVGPRPNVIKAVENYTLLEQHLLLAKPGVTDFSSVVYSDEGEILKDEPDPDIAYNQLIRPPKSSLGLFYIEHQSISVDIQLIWLTAVSMISRPLALREIQRLLRRLGANQTILGLASRQSPLIPMPPPGGDLVVTSRDGNPFI